MFAKNKIMDTQQTVPNIIPKNDRVAQLRHIVKADFTANEILELKGSLCVKSDVQINNHMNGKVKNELLATCFIIKANEIINQRKK